MKTPEKLAEQLKDKITELKARHSEELHLLVAAGEHCIATSPSPAQYQQFKDYAADDRKRTRALEMLTRACVVHPDPAGLEALLGRKPGLATSFGGKLLELAGAVEEVEAKKL
jgi:hypothetical protein